MKNLAFLLLFLCSLLPKSVDIYPNTDSALFFNRPNTTYIVHDTIDLEENTIVMPMNCTLKITDKGYVTNGIIHGNNTRLSAKRRKVLGENCTLTGKWTNKVVYGEWALPSDESIVANHGFTNIMILCSGTHTTHLYLPDVLYKVTAVDKSAPIIVPSNVYWHNKATIKMLPSSYEKYNIVLIDRTSNITIEGGRFIGDIANHRGNTGEWGHGIKVRGGKNVELKSLECNECWGDGIDLIEAYSDDGLPCIICQNVNINNVRCLYNRRQGLSIEAAANVSVTNCEFAYTGKLLSTAPSAGVDIEPWNTEGQKINSIRFNGCNVHNNVGKDVLCLPNMLFGKDYQIYKNEILFKNCIVGTFVSWETNGLILSRCILTDSLKISHSNNIDIEHSKIKYFKLQNNGNSVNLKGCNIEEGMP